MKSITIRLRLDNDTNAKQSYEKSIFTGDAISVSLNAGDKIILGSVKMRLIHKTYDFNDDLLILTAILERMS